MWFRQCFDFYKLANELGAAEHYQQAVKKLSTATSIYDFAPIFTRWQGYEFFDILDILPQLLALFNRSGLSLRDQLRDWNKFSHYKAYVGDHQEHAVIDALIENALNSAAEFDAIDFVAGKRATKNEQLQHKLDQRLLQRFQEYITDYHDGKMNEDTVVQVFTQIRTYVDDAIFENLLKDFGIDIYVKLRRINKLNIEKVLMHPYRNGISVYLAARIIAQLHLAGKPINKEMMLKLIKEGDGETHDFLRSHLFMDVNAGGDMRDGFFMLDETMQPMNVDLQPIEFPAEMKLMSVEGINDYYKEIKDKWRQIFHDFNVVPQGKLEFHPV